MAHAVFFKPSTPSTNSGAIVAMVSGPLSAIEGDGRPFVLVDEGATNMDVTHKVVNGQVVAKGDD